MIDWLIIIFKYFHSVFSLLEFKRWLLKHYPEKEKVHDQISRFIISTYGNVLLNRENESYCERLYSSIFCFIAGQPIFYIIHINERSVHFYLLFYSKLE